MSTEHQRYSTENQADAIRRYHEHRGQAADLLRSAAANERDALVRFEAIVEPK